MSLEKAKADLEQKGFLDHVIELKKQRPRWQRLRRRWM